MNAEVLASGRQLDGSIADVAIDVRKLVADLTDAWPGRREEAEIYASRVARSLQDARADLGVLVAVLAQDVAP